MRRHSKRATLEGVGAMHWRPLNTLFPGDFFQSRHCILRKNISFFHSHQHKHWLFVLGAAWLSVDFRSAETLGFSAIMIFTWFIVTHVSILTSNISNVFFNTSSLIYGTFRYQKNIDVFFRRFGKYLQPRYIFGAIKHRPVIYYDFFKRWLLPSQLPGCQSLITSFSTQVNCFKTLTNDLGCFPLDFRP